MSTTTNTYEGAYSLDAPNNCHFILPIKIEADVGTAEYAEEAKVTSLDNIDLYFNTIESLDLKASDINTILKFQMKDGPTGNLFNAESLAAGTQEPTYEEIFVEFLHISNDNTKKIPKNANPNIFKRGDGDDDGDSGYQHLITQQDNANIAGAVNSAEAIFNVLQELSAPVNNNHIVSLEANHPHTNVLQHVLHTVVNGTIDTEHTDSVAVSGGDPNKVVFRPGPMAMLPIQYLNAITAGTTNSQLVRNVDGIRQAFHNEQIGLDFLNELLCSANNHTNASSEGTNSPLLKSLLDIMLTNNKRHVFTQDTLAGLLHENDFVAPSRINDITKKEYEYLQLNSFNFYPGDKLTFRLDFDVALNIDTKSMPQIYADLINQDVPSTIANPNYLTKDDTPAQSTIASNQDANYKAKTRRTAVTIRLTESSAVCENKKEDAQAVLSAIHDELLNSTPNSVQKHLDDARAALEIVNLDIGNSSYDDSTASRAYTNPNGNTADPDYYWEYTDANVLFGSNVTGSQTDYADNKIAIDYTTFADGGNITTSTVLKRHQSRVAAEAEKEVLNRRIAQLEGARAILLVKERYWDNVVKFWNAEQERAEQRENFNLVHTNGDVSGSGGDDGGSGGDDGGVGGDDGGVGGDES